MSLIIFKSPNNALDIVIRFIDTEVESQKVTSYTNDKINENYRLLLRNW